MKDKYNKIKQMIQDKQFSGVISIKKGNKTLFEIAGGYRDIPNKLENTIDTKFGLASGAKTFVSIAILHLQEEGKLNIDDPISTYINDQFKNYDKAVTIKHLLSHTSGIPDYLDEEKDEDLSHIPWYRLEKPEDYFPYFPKTQMDFTPGTKFKYNNGAFILLAHIIDKVTGDFYGYIHSLLEGVGLKNTGYYRFDNLPSNTANGYIFDEKGNYKTNIYVLPVIGSGDGGIYSTVEDLFVLWSQLFSYQVLSKESIELLKTPVIKASDESYYGLGVWMKKTDTLNTVEMVGQDQGVSYISIYNIDTEEVITIISNNDSDAWKVLKVIEEK